MFAGETLRRWYTYVFVGRPSVLFTHTHWSYLRGDLRVAVRGCGNVFPEGLTPPCSGRKGFCRIHAHHGRRRSVPSNREGPTEQPERRDSNILSHRDGMAGRTAQRGGNQPFRLGRSSDSVRARHPLLDEWHKSRAERSEFTKRSTRRNDVLHGFRDAPGGWGRRSHAVARRGFWSKAHRPASLAHVLWPVHRGRVFFA